MKRMTSNALLICSTLALLLVPTSTQATTFETSLRQFARELGVGWGEGYHHRPANPALRPQYARYTSQQRWCVTPAPAYPATPFAPNTYNIPPSQSRYSTSTPYSYHNMDQWTNQADQQKATHKAAGQYKPADEDDSYGSDDDEPSVYELDSKTKDDSEWIPKGREEDAVTPEIDSEDDLLGREVMDDENDYLDSIDKMLREQDPLNESLDDLTPATNGAGEMPSPTDGSMYPLQRDPKFAQPTLAKPAVRQARPAPQASPQAVFPAPPVKQGPPVQGPPVQRPYGNQNIWW